jgi:hypothetical protein
MGIRRPIKPHSWLWHRSSRASHLRVAAVLTFAALLPACTASQLAELPTSMGGQTPDTPRAPASAPAFPAVHDMPPARPVPVMTEDEQKQAEAELIAARDRQSRPAPKTQVQKKPQQAVAKQAPAKTAPAKEPPAEKSDD